ncbi:hypothetical protein DID88_005671 [Monilinia fructigena]|uniref:RGS domain-containing protein n=1 Tax=Monilinia fructigena TaxID=38457 RepID=A0A395J0H5_9HELO|nr:hypothetical protein DID88_005671 [Monilinia fructigena]
MPGFIPHVREIITNIKYRRPDYISAHSSSNKTSRDSSMDLAQAQSETSSKFAQGIPDALSFDNIINGGTCPPITVREFMKYLEHIERAQENLQFFLWFRDYTLRFEKYKPSNPFSTPPATATSDNKAFGSSEYQNDSAVRFCDGAEDERPINKMKSIMDFPPQFIAPWETDLDKEGGSLMEVPSAKNSYRMITEKTFVCAGIKNTR